MQFFRSPLLILVLGSISLCPTRAGAAPFRICTLEWLPFTYVQANQAAGQAATVQGAHARIIHDVFAHVGGGAEIQVLPLSRCLAAVADGSQDGAYEVAWSEERAAIALYARPPLFEITNVFVIRKGEYTSWSRDRDPARLPQPIGVPHGYAAVRDLDRIAGVTVFDHAASDSENVQTLVAGRVGAILGSTEVLRATISRAGVGDQLEILSPPYAASARLHYIIVTKLYGGSETAAAAMTARISTAVAAVVGKAVKTE